VGWRERDWAKWTDAERERFLGSSRPSARGAERPPPARWSPKGAGGPKRHIRRQTIGGLILAAALVTNYTGVLNNLSPQHTVNTVTAPTSYLRLPQAPPTSSTPAPPSPRYTTMSGPSSVPRGTYMTVTGTLPRAKAAPSSWKASGNQDRGTSSRPRTPAIADSGCATRSPGPALSTSASRFPTATTPSRLSTSPECSSPELRARMWRWTDTLASPRNAGASWASARTTVARPLQARDAPE
jgi:hypothetical protein